MTLKTSTVRVFPRSNGAPRYMTKTCADTSPWPLGDVQVKRWRSVSPPSPQCPTNKAHQLGAADTNLRRLQTLIRGISFSNKSFKFVQGQINRIYQTLKSFFFQKAIISEDNWGLDYSIGGFSKKQG